jgi:hypothetical protein
MSPEQVKHYIREAGFEAEFTTAPQALFKLHITAKGFKISKKP